MMDPVVATYMIPVRQWAAASEKLNIIAHHILLVFRAYILSQKEALQTEGFARPPDPYLRFELSRGSAASTW